MKRVLSLLTVFVLTFCLTVPTFAYDFNGSNYQDDVLIDGNVIKLQELWEDMGQPHMILWQNSSTGAIAMYVVEGELYKNWQGNLTFGTDARYIKMVYDSQHRWVYNENWEIRDDGLYLFNVSDARWTAKTIYNDEGTTVVMEGDSNFRVPLLAEMVLELSEEELVTVAIPEMVGALKILAPCGVGLMALLVGLRLFGKRSLLFLR